MATSIEGRSFERDCVDLAHSRRTPAQYRFGGENDEGDPDHDERDQVFTRKRFVIQEHAEKERADWGEILKEPDGDQPQMARRVAEQKKRKGSDDAGADEQDRQPPAVAAEIERAGMLEVKKKNDGEGHEQDCFDEQTRDRRGAGLFSKQFVKSEGEA